MQWRALSLDVWEGTRAQGSRVTLSFIGIATGMVALVLLLAVVGGLRERSRAMIRDLGVNVFALVQTRAEEGRTTRGQLSRRHLAILNENLGHVTATAVSWSPLPESDVKGGGTLIAADENILKVRPWSLNAGRGFDREDIRTHARYALVGKALCDAGGLALGSDIRIHSVPFRVIGIVGSASDSLSSGAVEPGVFPGERVVLVPWSVNPYRAEKGVDEGLSAIFLKVADPDSFSSILKRTESLLMAPDCNPGSLNWVTPEGLVDKLLRLQRSILWAGGSIVVLCILLGSSTLTALLLAGIQQRVPEIGLRRALGASASEVGLLFLGEALFITLGASLIGVFVASLLLILGRSWFPFDVHIGVTTVFYPLLFGGLVGVLSSFLPARAAARITPSEALRND